MGASVKVLVLVPARAGSKGLPGKNLRRVGGVTLVGHAVRAGKRFLSVTGLAGTVLVDTDSEEIAKEGLLWGAIAPFLRPPELAADTTPLVESVLFAIDRLGKHHGTHDVVVLLQPTSPLREVEDIVECWKAYDPHVGSVVSIAPVEHLPEYLLRRSDRGVVTWAWEDIERPTLRQHVPPSFRPSGAVYISSVTSLREHHSFVVPGLTRGVSMPRERALDIHEPVDLAIADELRTTASVPPVKLGQRYIGAGFPTYVIAEAGVNHGGDPALAHRLIDIAANAGADAVKFQTFDPTKVVSSKAQMAAYQIENTGRTGIQVGMMAGLELSHAAHRELCDHARDRGIQFLSSPFDEGSADFLEELGVPAFSVDSFELTNHPFLEYLAKQGLPLLVSTGMANLAEVDSALDVILRSGGAPAALLHCAMSYPSAPEDSNLRAIETLRAAFRMPTGYSDHTLGIHVSLAAVAMGASIIEKHFTVGRWLPGPGHQASLEPDDLSALVRSVRDIETAFGEGLKEARPKEIPLIAAARRSLHAARDLPTGHVLVASDLVALRPGTGISPVRLATLVGRRLAKPILLGDLLEEDHLE